MQFRDYSAGASALAVLMACGAVMVLPDYAHAACTPAAADGATVTCTGTNLPAFFSGAFTGVTLNVAPGASITGAQNTGGTAPNFQFSSVTVGDNSTVNNDGLIQNNGSQRRDNVGVNLAGTGTTLNNSGTISVNYLTASNSANFRLYGVISSAPDGVTYGNVQVTNTGTISLTQNSASVARGIYAGEGIDSMTVDNFGTVSVIKNGNATSTQAVAGVDADDDTDTLVVNNHTTGRFVASGANSYAVGGRAQDYTIQNDGVISAAAMPASGANPATAAGRAAILIYGGGDDEAASTTIDNSATGAITGNVSITDTSPFGVTLPTTTIATRDSDVTNEGTINGAFLYGAGTHTLDNSGAISGGITVNQQVGSVGGALITGVGGASFTLTNEGTLGGNIAINDRPDSINSITLTGTGYAADGNIATTGLGANSLTLDGVTNLGGVANFSALDLVQSNVAVANGVSLVDDAQINTTIFGPGGTAAAPTTNLGSIQGTLALQGDANITPTFAGIARNGDVYALATGVVANGDITIDRTALVSFTPDATSGALLLQANVRDARTVAGISTPGAQTINALTSYGGTNAGVQSVGGAVENLGSDAQVAAAAQALSPIVNGADVQMPINATMLFHQQIDARLDNFLFAQIPVAGRSADLGVARPVPVYGALPLNAAWIEGIGGGVHQSTRQGVSGYNADLTGVIGGYDRFVLPSIRLGGAFGFINAEVNGNSNLNGNRETIQTYQGLVYGSYEGPRTYARVSVGYGGVDYRSTRQIGFAGFNGSASGRHDGDILTVRGEGGVPVETRAGLVVPYGAFTYGHLTQGGYSEQGGNGAGFTYGGTTNDSERGEIGGKLIVPIVSVPVLSYLFPTGSILAAEARAAYVHEFGNVAQNVTAGFVGGGGNVFIVNGPNPSREMVDYGVGLRLGTGPVQIDVSYNGLARSTYLQQVGLLRARYLF